MTPTDSAPVAIIGGYFTSNMGGAGMTQAVVEHAKALGIRCSVLTIYPRGDQEHAPPHVDLVPWRPRDIVFSIPLAVLVWLARLVHLPIRSLLRTPGLRALAGAKVVADVAGISFVDGRGIPILAYNTLMTGIPLLLGTPVVKVAQAMGPFHGAANRILARAVLSRVHTVVARGGQTTDHLSDLRLVNTVEATDIAFTMPVGVQSSKAARSAVETCVGSRPFVAVVPSSVVKGYCDNQGIDYIGQMGELARRIHAELDIEVLVIPHSVHPSGREGRMHDVTVAQNLVRQAGGHTNLLEPGLGPDGLRAAIGMSAALVTSRFHGMVSGLATCTPTLVVGWSHKYAEVLGQFDLADWAIDYSHLDASTMLQRVQDLMKAAPSIREQIRASLPAVEASARTNLDAIDSVLAMSH